MLPMERADRAAIRMTNDDNGLVWTSKYRLYTKKHTFTLQRRFNRKIMVRKRFMKQGPHGYVRRKVSADNQSEWNYER